MIQHTIYGIYGKAVLAVLTMMLSFTAFAQVTVSGVVTDETDQPMIGAGVMQKGTGNGTVTDIDGKFTLVVPSDAVLVFNYISYKTVEVNVAGQTILNVQLLPDNTVLDEVVVIGYGTMKRSDLTGSVSSVSAKSIENFKTASVVDALGGQIAGVNVTMADGTPGSGYDIKIRGVGTVNGDSSPLYIVDGFEVANIDFLANQDIQSIEVLKDASASAIYGARAANGVVLVTTKSGREGKPQVTYNGSASYRQLSKRVDMLNPYEFIAMQVEFAPSKYGSTYYKPGTNPNTGLPYEFQTLEDYLRPDAGGVDWQNEAFRPTWSQNHDVSVRGGTKDTQYTVSFSHFDENGIFRNSGYRKDNARLKLMQKITKWLRFDATINYTNAVRTGQGTSGGSLANLLRYRPKGGLGVSDYDLLHSVYDPVEEGVELSSGNTSINPLIQAGAVDNTRGQEQWIASASLLFTITKGLTFKTSGTYNANYQRNDVFYGEDSSQARASGPYGYSQMGRVLRWSNNNVLDYNRTFAKKHRTTFTLGHEVSFNGTEYLLGESMDFPFGDFGVDNLGLGANPSRVETSRTENMRLSFFARAFYSYSDRYMLTATVRADASTVFSKSHKWGFFPSFAGAWTISNEKFLEDADWLSMLKLRVGWGTVGNDRISSYLSQDLYSASKYGVGSEQIVVLTPKQIANQDLKWEGSTTTNLGIDFNVLDSRLNVTVDAFLKDTKDLLLAQKLAHVTGFDTQWQNVGKIRNMGVEFTVSSVNFNRRNFFWTTDFNISYVKNKLMALQSGTSYISTSTSINSNFSQDDYISYVGSALGDMYGYVYDGVYQYSDFYRAPGTSEWILKPGVADISEHAGRPAEPGMVKYRDINGDGKITSDDRTTIGNGQPEWFGGLTNSFQFYGVDLSFMLQFSMGNEVYNATRMFCTQSQDERSNAMGELRDRWTPTNASNKVPSVDGYIKYDVYSRFIEDGSFLRLKNLTLGYTIPEKLTRKIHVSKLRVYGTATNLFCLTKYSGYDPEVSTKSSPLMPSFDWGAYPRAKTFTFGLELQF